MRFDPQRYHRRSIRLRDYDYTKAGAYFVTICTQNRECRFGEIIDEQIRLNENGQVVAECWAWLGQQYRYVELDVWVVMPNHVHGIIVIADDHYGHDYGRGGSRTAPTKHKPLGRLIGAFKTVTTKRINAIGGNLGVRVWQRNYYEHIIRNDEELNRIREYIANNPSRWETDVENPDVAMDAIRLAPKRTF